MKISDCDKFMIVIGIVLVSARVENTRLLMDTSDPRNLIVCIDWKLAGSDPLRVLLRREIKPILTMV